ncbi:hypothetical protein ASE49_14045 [Novosphingobium sp. Leaf2]|nr:hypothetical protein ASE49_14045 [Novosphingobium sp. Leaf2]
MLLMLPSACSTTRSPTPELQANLRQRCLDLPGAPVSLVDPDRGTWEEAIIATYGDCAGRHRATVEAWPTSQ